MNWFKCSIDKLVADHLRLSSTSWSIGVVGAIAEFFRVLDETAVTDGATYAVTERGAIRIVVNSATRATAYETGTGGQQAIALCLPETGCTMHGRRVVTEVGADCAALRKCDRSATLFDLGLGSPFFDFYVRTAEPEQIRRLREGAGLPLFDPCHGLLAEIAAMHPHRVFASKLGRVEVFQRIAGAGEATPEGPHTHLLPELLKSGRAFGAETPIPAGWIPCATLYDPGIPGHASNPVPHH